MTERVKGLLCKAQGQQPLNQLLKHSHSLLRWNRTEQSRWTLFPIKGDDSVALTKSLGKRKATSFVQIEAHRSTKSVEVVFVNIQDSEALKKEWRPEFVCTVHMSLYLSIQILKASFRWEMLEMKVFVNKIEIKWCNSHMILPTMRSPFYVLTILQKRVDGDSLFHWIPKMAHEHQTC